MQPSLYEFICFHCMSWIAEKARNISVCLNAQYNCNVCVILMYQAKLLARQTTLVSELDGFVPSPLSRFWTTISTVYKQRMHDYKQTDQHTCFY